jgi:hypothetical protein
MNEPVSLNATVTDASGAADANASRAVRSSSHGKITVADKFEIDLNRPVPEFSHAFADAYECSGDGKSNDCIAVVVKGRYPVRYDVIKVALQADIPGLIVLRTTGIANWTADGTQRFVLIYRRPPGTPLFNNQTMKREALTEDVLRRNIMRPLFFALKSLTERNVFHGNIRPDNIFYSGNENAEAVLGECTSSIPGIIQPAVYETIERAMADPHGKGAGNSLDDIYSFGATIAILLRGEDPFSGKSDKYIVEQKINESSFNALTDGIRLSPGLAEFLRATLNDDQKQRWTIEQVGAWIDGTRTTPKQTSLSQKAQRTMDFNGKKYTRPRLLARDLPDNMPEAVAMIESGYLSKWLERALGDHEKLAIVNEAIERAGVGGRSAGFEDRLVCFVCMALDPRAPIRYKTLSVFPQGLGNSMVYAMFNGLNVQSYAEFIRDRFAWIWLGYKENNTTDESTDLLRKYDAVSKLIIRRGINFGMERCLYELAPSAPCLSDMLKNHYVVDCSDLIGSLDNIASRSKGSKPIDRHIASFISVHDSHDNSGIMSSLDSGDRTKYSLALLTLYQGLQKRSDHKKLVDMCEWLMADAQIVVQRFFNLKLKEEMQKMLDKEVKSGSIRRMLSLIDNPLQVRKDADEFQKATLFYRALGAERDRMRNELDRNPVFGQGSGQHLAMVISAVISGVVIASLVLINFLGRLGEGL